MLVLFYVLIFFLIFYFFVILKFNINAKKARNMNPQKEHCDTVNENHIFNEHKQEKSSDISLEEENYNLISKKLDEKLDAIIAQEELNQLEWDNYNYLDDINLDSKSYLLSRRTALRNELSKYQKSMSSPYFGRLIITTKLGKSDIYIGEQSLSDKNSENLVFDWRSPICSLYYVDQLINTVRLPSGKYSCKTLLKRRIEIKNKVFLSARDIYSVWLRQTKEFAGGAIYDEFLSEILKVKKGETEFSDIIQTIQSWQNNLIRADINDNILCQGVAGSGKTAIILHRLSYLLYNYPEVKYNQYLIICPSKLFKNNIGKLNEKLGINNIPMMTISEYYWLKLAPVFYKDYKFEDKELLEDTTVINTLTEFFKNKYLRFINNSCLNDFDQNKSYYEQINACKKACFDKRRKDLEVINFLKQLFDNNLSNTNLSFEKLVTKAYCDFSASYKECFSDFRNNPINNIYELANVTDEDSAIIKQYINLYKYCQQNLGNDLGEEKFSKVLFRIYSSIKYNTYNLSSSERIKSKQDLLNQLNQCVNYIDNRNIDNITKLTVLEQECNNYLDIEKLIKEIIVESCKYVDYKIKDKTINSNLLKLILYISSTIGFKLNLNKADDAKNNISRKFTYVYIDEAQNYDSCDLSIITKLENNKGINLYGDIHQRFKDNIKSWSEIVEPLKDNLKTYSVDYNYRNTVQVVEYCNNMLKTNMKAIGPRGNMVREYELVNNLKDILIHDQFVYIVKLESLYNFLKQNGKIVYYINEVKGMEFSNVIVIDCGMNLSEKYVAYTRTLNDLIVYRDNILNNKNKYNQATLLYQNPHEIAGRFKIHYLDEKDDIELYFNIQGKDNNISVGQPIFNELFNTDIGKLNTKYNFIMIDKKQCVPYESARNSFSVDDLKIYNLTNYIPKRHCVNDENSNKILALKNRNNLAITYFSKRVYTWLKQNDFLNKETILVVVPGHNASFCNISGMVDLVENVTQWSEVINGANIIFRNKTINKKSTSELRPSYYEDLNSLSVNKYIDFTDKTIIILDDVITTGNSMKAVAEILYKHGATKVIALAIGRTQRFNE